jgi:hypothetical protein
MTPAELLDRVRGICLAFPETSERPSHGAHGFFVRQKRSFTALYLDGHHDNHFPHLWCAAPPGAQQELIGDSPDVYFRPPYVGHRGWVGVRLVTPGTDWTELAEVCREAYRAVAPATLIRALDAG